MNRNSSLNRKTRSLWFLLGLACACWAQGPTPAAHPNLDLTAAGTVNAIAQHPDGSMVVGGSFTSVMGQKRVNLARFNSDGTLDPAWAPSVNGSVRAISIAANGDVFIGGEFNQINGQSRSFLAKITGDGGQLDSTWNPSPNGNVRALGIDAEGRLVVGGGFSLVGGASRRNLARLASAGSGAVDPVWNPSPDSAVEAIAIDPNGLLYVGGQFSEIAGQPRATIARFLAESALDSTWHPDAERRVVRAIAFGADGSVYVAGAFGFMGGQQRNHLAKLSSIGGGQADPDWNPSPDNGVLSLAVDQTGAVFVGGSFNMIGGQARGHLAKLSGNGTGAADPSWNYKADEFVRALSFNDQQDLVVAGSFSTLAQKTRLGLALVSTVGVSDRILDVEFPGQVLALVQAAGGGVFVGGNFAKAGGLPRHNLLRVDATGKLDPTWNPSTNAAVNTLALGEAGSIYAGGYFSMVNDEPRGRLAKISTTGAGLLDTGWNASVDDAVLALAVGAADAVYAGGFFTLANEQPRNFLARFAGTDGSVDPVWNPSANNYVFALAVDNNALYAGGWFSTAFSPISIGGQPREGIAKLSMNGAGAADSAWSPVIGDVRAIALDDTGHLYAGGNSSRVRKVSRATGVVDVNWLAYAPISGADSVSAIAFDRAGSLYVGGMFWTPVSDQQRRLARVSSEGAGVVDSTWDPMPDVDGIEGYNAINGQYVLAVDERGTVFVGGGFFNIGGVRRIGLAAFPDIVFKEGFD